MGTITGRTCKDGSKAFTAQIVIKKGAPSSIVKLKHSTVGGQPMLGSSNARRNSSVRAGSSGRKSFLGIEDLRFHDLRHEGISRLFEMGKTIPQAAAVSGQSLFNSTLASSSWVARPAMARYAYSSP
jgi:hypothetical protein